MDSATSGSLQSSSGGGGGGGGGGDDELDSRADALSAFFHGPALSHPFDSLAHYLSPPSPLLPFSAPAPAPLTNPSPSRPFLSSSSASSHGRATSASSAAAASGASAPAAAAATGQQRSSRKRTRASRRAPTTVLTTDTTNFRAMVQEFTGIPSPPFAAAAAAAAAASTLQYRSSARFAGHFLTGGGGASSSSSAAAADPSAQPQQPPYLLRPFAQKLQPFPPLSSPSNTHSPTATPTTTTASAATNSVPITATLTTCSSSSGSGNLTTPTNTNYQLPSPHHSLLNTQHHILSFQSLLQSQPPSNYPMPSMLAFSTRPPHLPVPSAQYGSGDVGLPPGLMGSEELSGWAGGNAATQSRPAGPNYAAGSAAQLRGSSCKVNYSSAAGSSVQDQFNAEKGSSALENAAAGAATTTTTTTTTIGEGTVDSWIRSSRHDH